VDGHVSLSRRRAAFACTQTLDKPTTLFRLIAFLEAIVRNDSVKFSVFSACPLVYCCHRRRRRCRCRRALRYIDRATNNAAFALCAPLYNLTSKQSAWPADGLSLDPNGLVGVTCTGENTR
jgi:hypothetical protein